MIFFYRLILLKLIYCRKTDSGEISNIPVGELQTWYPHLYTRIAQSVKF